MAGLSVIIPASNEAGEIEGCLKALLMSDPKPGFGSGSIPVAMPIEVVVVANGCLDATADKARSFAPEFQRAGWGFQVLELAAGSKSAALNAGDGAARHRARAYLDADVRLNRALLDQLARVLQSEKPVFASGKCRISPPKSFVSRSYARIYAQVPFMKQGVPGCGLFGVSAAGRRRWGSFPDIISDDTFVRLQFQPSERLLLRSTYDWPIAEGLYNLVCVRERQNRGVKEIKTLYPALLANDDKPGLKVGDIARLALRDPLGFAIYSSVALLTRFRKSEGWSRGR